MSTMPFASASLSYCRSRSCREARLASSITGSGFKCFTGRFSRWAVSCSWYRANALLFWYLPRRSPSIFRSVFLPMPSLTARRSTSFDASSSSRSTRSRASCSVRRRWASSVVRRLSPEARGRERRTGGFSVPEPLRRSSSRLRILPSKGRDIEMGMCTPSMIPYFSKRKYPDSMERKTPRRIGAFLFSPTPPSRSPRTPPGACWRVLRGPCGRGRRSSS